MSILDFLASSPTAYHAVNNAESILLAKGYQPLKLGDNWSLLEDGKYYLCQEGALIAWSMSKSYEFKLAMSHTDSPALHIKGNTLIDSAEGKRINVEAYGGGLWYTWLDIPLCIAGRVFVQENGVIVRKLVRSTALFTIPSMCVHHNPEASTKPSISIQNDMLPLAGDAVDVYSLVALGETVLDADLYMVPALAPYLSGASEEHLVAPRIDNLTSVYSSIEALTSTENDGICMICLMNHEEIGSGTKEGAGSALLANVLEGIRVATGHSTIDQYKALQKGLLLSIDNGHAVHPSYPQKSDPVARVVMGKGVVIKHHTNYSTDGKSSAIFKALCLANGVAFQDYYNHSDIRCGGTLGLIVSRNLNMDAVDVGLAQLAMHSAVETVAKADVDTMTKALSAFFGGALPQVNVQ